MSDVNVRRASQVVVPGRGLVPAGFVDRLTETGRPRWGTMDGMSVTVNGRSAPAEPCPEHRARRTRPPVTRTVVSALVITLVLVATTAAFPARPAWAHAHLLRTEPAAGSVVDQPVSAVTLVFNEPVRERFSTVLVTAADGTPHSDGAVRAVDATLVQAVTALPAGPVRVSWRMVSVDGDPVTGQFTFTNAAPGAPGARQSAAASPTAGARDGGARDGGARDGRRRWPAAVLAALVLALVVGLAAGATVVWRRRGGPRPRG